jgi:threonine dehydratase
MELPQMTRGGATAIDLSLANIEKAASVIDPVFLNSPQFVDEQLSAALGTRTIVKVETANPIRSFKGRGADFMLRNFDVRQKAVCASAGNFGQAIAYAGRSRGIAVEVFVPTDANPLKIARMRSFGATVIAIGSDFDDSKQYARQHVARNSDCVFVEDGHDPAIAEGAGTIGVELLRAGTIDAVIVPLGDGALISGVALWVKEHSPRTKIVGVCAEGAAAMEVSWRAGHAVSIDTADTFADGIAVRVPVADSVTRVNALVDDIVLVSDAQMLEAMRIAASTLGLLLEPSGAAGLAAIRAHRFAGDQIATILTGSNIHPDLIAKVVG